MRKYLYLIILFSCLHIAARGQTIASLDDIDLSGLPQPTTAKALRYWFDDDGGSVVTVSQLSGPQELDVSPLRDGLHTLHYQVIDENDKVADVCSKLFMKVNGQTIDATAKQLRYWFDDDVSTLNTITATSGTQAIDASMLIEGLHTIHFQVEGVSGSVSYVASGIFMKTGSSSDAPLTAKKLIYWFDDETTASTIDVSDGVQVLDAANLQEGLHTIHYQVLCSDGMLTPTQSSLFMRMVTDAESSVAKSLRYWFDDAQTVTTTEITTGSTMLDASALIEGLHTIHYQVVDSKGSLSTPVSSVFMKMDATAGTVANRLRYWFDDDASSVREANVSQGVQMLDVSGLLTGLHTVCYQLIDDNGKVGTPYTGIFMKAFDKVIATGENRINQYQYWLNNRCEAMQTVTLDDATNPYTLIGLLPMQNEPIRSQLFHFEITDGEPTVYARNEFHIRFHDAAGYFVDDFKTFVDYNVKQTVTDIEVLQSNICATTAKPAQNTIKWYCLAAEPGDSVQFRLDRAATVQLFTPSGEELLSASGSETINWFGCHVREAGTYYLALHDVTATWGNDISIDYEHIDKYAVLRQDVSVVGNGGCSTITFEGNGFRDLYAVDLFTEQGALVQHVYIGHESDATTSIVFDFTDAALGTYNAKFRFAEEDKVFNNLVTVEEARDIELITTSNHASQFLRGTTTSYTFNVKNCGNMTAYSVPIYAYVSCKTLSGISNIRLKGLKLKNLYEYIENKDIIDTKTLAELRSMCDNMGDDHYFNKFATTDEQTGDSIVVRSGFFTIDLQPNTTKTITIEIQSTEEIEVWLTIPDEWHSIILNDEMKAKVRTTRSATDWLCCYHERLECLGTIIVNVADIVGVLPIPQAKIATVVSCVTGAINQGIKSTANVLCNEENAKKSFYDKIKSIADGISVTGTILTCASGLVKADQLKELLSCLSLAGDELTHPFAAVDCISAWSKKKPNCPPIPPNGGTSTSVASLDPNDIYGYTAESGSHAVKDGKTDVYYRIEFENDPKFATAAAHEIVVTDTLDATKFDLSTFAPTRIQIGNKSAELTGDKNFVTTIDMRPEINAIAQVEGTYDQTKGIAKWHITSLDSMTMEPTQYVMDGVLPVNTNGNGIGELFYDIQLKPGLAHGTEIKNRAGIVFDTNEKIMTPYWTNVIDRVAPESQVTNVVLAEDGTAAVSIAATDEMSGPWRYDVYVQYGQGSSWFMAAENVAVDKAANVKIYPGIDHGFCTVATDAAGNVEEKTMSREFSLRVSYIPGDVNGDGKVTITDVLMIIDKANGNAPEHFIEEAADLNHDSSVTLADAMIALDMILTGSRQ